MIEAILILILSLVVLVGSGHGLVRGSVSIATKFNISSLVIGLTVVAFGTSAPELIVSVQAAVAGHPDIALGNVVGSNIANVALVLGLTAMVITLPVVSKRLLMDWFVMMLSYLFLWLALQNNHIGPLEGVIMILGVVAFTWLAIRKSMNTHSDNEEDLPIKKPVNIWMAVLLVILSCAGLAWGASLLVDSASEIAVAMGVSERVISISIVAFGTSVPELTASLVAAFKKETEISVGNIVGSNLFNVLVVLGTTAVVHPIEVSYDVYRSDLLWMVLIGILLLVLIYPFKDNMKQYRESKKIMSFYGLNKGRLSFMSGFLLVALYIIYFYFLYTN